MSSFCKPVVLAVYLLSMMSSVNAQTSTRDTLYQNFLNPPNSAKPRVWWHWMNGNITKDGIAKDLAWMKRAGIGGFHNFDAALATPQIVKKRLVYMTPEWKDAFRFTTLLADSLKLEMAIAGSPGWSESGGSWVKPSEGMKKVVWTETSVQGGKLYTGKLPKPPSTTGIFQNLSMAAEFGSASGFIEPQFYKDIAVLAYRMPVAEQSMADLNPVISSSGGKFTLAQLTDNDLETTSLLPSDQGQGVAWIQYSFKKPVTIKSLTIVGGGDKGPFGLYGERKEDRSLESSTDGIHFTQVCFIPAGSMVQQTMTIPQTNSRYFRVSFKNPPALPDFGAMLGSSAGTPKVPEGTQVAELVLHTGDRINRFEEKAAFALSTDLYQQVNLKSEDITASKDVIDLTSNMQPDGSLSWQAPAGHWTLLRFGYSLTGITNHPASPEATGLEVDKLDPVAVKAYFTNYLDQYKNATGGLMGEKGGLQYLVTDSWEAGVQNWTGQLMAEFARRRGYSLLPWMPVLTGHMIQSADASERFLWDFRKTLAELVAENHYDLLTTLLHERGMKRYSESHENGRALLADGMDVKRTSDIPMAAMWMPGGLGAANSGSQADIRESASVAHIYGQNLVAAESLTAIGNAWSYAPEQLKPTADLELASGLNRFVIHTSAHQPTDDHIPGLGLGPFGQWFTRHETWAEQAKAWTAYLARSSYLLQQGKFVADIIYYYGEDNNITALFAKKLPDVPAGYNFDFLNTDALLNKLSVSDHVLTTSSGMKYRILALDSNSRQMTLNVLVKVRELVNAGAILVGPKPLGSPSMADDNTRFSSIADELWGQGREIKSIGQGKVMSGFSIAQALKELAIAQDFQVPGLGAEVLYVHRHTPEVEIYWVNNRTDSVKNLEAEFRVSGKIAEIWHPETGLSEPVSYSFADGRTRLPLHLQPNDAVFVIFKGNSALSSLTIPEKSEKTIEVLSGVWNVAFQKDRGAPASINLDSLSSWTGNSATGVKYFSGTGTYSRTIHAPAAWFKKGSHIWIDLGGVKNLAEVFVNGKSLGILWKKPFRADMTGILKKGDNTLEIRVTNLWVNRLIGDLQPGMKQKITYTTMAFYKVDSPLLASGLLGPVKIVQVN